MKSLKYYFLFLFFISFISCNDDEQIQTKEAKLEWQGEYAVDGCGFFVEIDGKKYKPENENIIGNELKTSDQLLVLIKFEYLNREIEYHCGLQLHKIEAIKIISIVKF